MIPHGQTGIYIARLNNPPGLAFRAKTLPRPRHERGLDIETCSESGGVVKVMPKALATLAGQALACIEDPTVIEKILVHLQGKDTSVPTSLLPESRAPPADLFG